MKKKIMIVFLAVAVAISGCGASKKSSVKNETACSDMLIKVAGDGVCSEWIDIETGVHYFCINSVCMCPRYNADGSLIVTEVNPCKSE